MIDWIRVLFLLLCGHAVMDYVLQSEWMVINKNRNIRKTFSPEQLKTMEVIWPHLLSAHAFTHGAAVYLVSHNFYLGMAETAAHWITDFGKCEGWYGFNTDQFIHIGCKIVWATLIFKGIAPPMV